jgi:hypothetical protein
MIGNPGNRGGFLQLGGEFAGAAWFGGKAVTNDEHEMAPFGRHSNLHFMPGPGEWFQETICHMLYDCSG